MNRTPQREIPPGRKTLYYGGMLISVVGLLLFISVFFSAAGSFGRSSSQFPDVRSADRQFSDSSGWFMRAIIGIVLIWAGQLMARIGRRGAAGAGIVLDPQQARQDLEPWSRAAGGMLDDALTEVKHVPTSAPAEAAPTVKVRCSACRALNDESAKFCSQCGAKL